MRDPITKENARQLTPLTHVRFGWITRVAWSPDGGTLAVAGADGVRLYVHKVGGPPTTTLTGHGGHVKGTAISGDGSRLASVASDTQVKIWDLSGDPYPEIATLSGHRDSVDAVAFARGRDLLATGSADHSVRLWRGSGDFLRELTGHGGEVSALAFSRDGGAVFSGGWDNAIFAWDAESGAGEPLGYHDDWIRDLAVSPDGSILASASKDMTVRLWRLDRRELVTTIYAHQMGADAVAFSPDGSLLATGGRDNVLRLWDVNGALKAGRVTASDALATFTGHLKPVMALAFHPAGTLLVSGSGDNTVRLWHIADVA